MEGLVGAVTRGQGKQPEGQLKEWLRSYGCEQEAVDAMDAARWLGVRKQEKAMERRLQLPGEVQRGRGEEGPEGPEYDDKATHVPRRLYALDVS